MEKRKPEEEERPGQVDVANGGCLIGNVISGINVDKLRDGALHLCREAFLGSGSVSKLWCENMPAYQEGSGDLDA